MRHITGESRQQSSLLPDTLDDYVDEDHPVRVIDAFVDTDSGCFFMSVTNPKSTAAICIMLPMRTITLLIICLLPFSISAKSYGDVIVTEVTSIYDADTFRVNIKDYPPIIGERIPVRVLGVDATEIRGKCQSEKVKAREAKQFTVQSLRSAKTIELKNMQRGKYFRILADVYVDGKSLANSLIQSEHARPYDGGKRLGWCE